jgi:hypothetical protein
MQCKKGTSALSPIATAKANFRHVRFTPNSGHEMAICDLRSLTDHFPDLPRDIFVDALA